MAAWNGSRVKLEGVTLGGDCGGQGRSEATGRSDISKSCVDDDHFALPGILFGNVATRDGGAVHVFARPPSCVTRIELHRSTIVGNVAALGSTGAHGTVLSGQDLAVFNLTASGGDPCYRAHSAEAGCDADHLTSGGCVWCDIVDRPAFCSTRTNARSLPRFPPHNCNWFD